MLLGVGGGEWGKGIVREFGMDMYRRLYLKWITSKYLLNTTWNSATLLSGSTDGRGNLRENGYMYIYMAESLCCSSETLITLFVNWLYSNKKLKKKFKFLL